jgi:tetratricopeptide (TPR) repeat protein
MLIIDCKFLINIFKNRLNGWSCSVGNTFKMVMAENSFSSIMELKENCDPVLEKLRQEYKADPLNMENTIRLIQYLSDQGWYNEAIDIARAAMEKDGQNYTLVLEYGNTCFRKNDLKEAEQAFLRLTRLKPDRIEGWNNLGIVRVQLSEMEKAGEAFAKVLSIEPDNPGALVNMGNHHTNKGELSKARAYFEHALQVRPDFTDAWYNLGNVLLAQEDYEGARAAFEKALKYQEDFSSALKNMGYACEKSGKYENAEQCYLQAIELNKADFSLRVNLGNLYLKQKKYDEAKKCYLKAVRLAPHMLPGWMGLRHLSLAKGDLNTFIRATLAILPRLDEDVLAQSIEILFEHNQIEKAEEILAQADRLGRRGDALDLQRLLIYQRKKNNSKKAEGIYKRLSEKPVLTDQIRKGLARYALHNKDYDTVIAHIEKMTESDSPSQSILWRALLARKEDRKVKQLVQLHIKEDPDYFDSWFILAVIEASRGNRIRAERFLIKALENGFTNMEELNQYSHLKQIFETLAPQ